MEAFYLNPSFIGLRGGTDEEYKQLAADLTFQDQTAYHAAKRHEEAYWYVNKYGKEAHQEELERLQALVDVCLLKESEDPNFDYQVMTGLSPKLANYVSGIFGEIAYPEMRSIALEHSIKTLRYYQRESVDRLLKAKHGAIELPTGSGKTAVIATLLREVGLKACVIAPTKSIANQLFKEFTFLFGKRRVGMMGDGKKVSEKLITVAIKDTLTRLEEGSKHWNELLKCQMVIVDESHTVPQQTLSKVCLGVFKDVPYRFFVSATQMRNDGKDMLLEGIIGNIVYRKELMELVEEGYLARPIHYAVRLQSHSIYTHKDALEMMRVHLYESPVIGRWAADFANKCVLHLNHQVLILIDQISQFKYIEPFLQYQCGFAFGVLNESNRDDVPERYRNDDNDDLVDRFNKKQLRILVGTSCIATGTDIIPTNTLIYLMGGKSEIKFSQARGRGTRICDDKKSFNMIDVDLDIDGLDQRQNPMHRHFVERTGYCTSKITYLGS